MTEQRQANIAAWLTRGPLRGFLDAAPDAIVVVDFDGTIVAVNRLTEAMFGYTPEELLGQTVEVLVPKRFHEAHRQHRREYAVDPRTRPMGEGRVLSGRRKDRSEFPVEISLSPLETDHGTVVISIIRDITQRRRAEAKFRGLLESAPDGIVVVDTSGSIVIVNSQTERMFGYPRKELIGQPVELLVPERLRTGHVGYRDGYFRAPKTRPMGAGMALTGRKRDGTEFPVEISLSPLETEQGMLVTSIIRDISERRKAEQQLKASLQEKEILLKEIHHRVKNNLQITSSLLKLQSAYIQDPRARELFAESQNRIRSMALVHEKLYRSGNLSQIDFSGYVESLSALLLRSYGIDSSRISLELRMDQVLLGVDVAVPCGLMVNELLSNCFKHAFPEGMSGVVCLQLTREEGGRFTLAVRDNGVGLPEHIDAAQTEALGLQLVHTLAGQLGAEIEVIRERGTEFRIHCGEARA